MIIVDVLSEAKCEETQMFYKGAAVICGLRKSVYSGRPENVQYKCIHKSGLFGNRIYTSIHGLTEDIDRLICD